MRNTIYLYYFGILLVPAGTDQKIELSKIFHNQGDDLFEILAVGDQI